MKSKQEQMWEILKDKDFRQQIIDEHVNEGIAFQIRSLRNRQELKQSDLAKLMDVKQPLISSWEDPNYGKYTLGTLKVLAKAFDVGLLVRFVSFNTLVDWTINLTSDVIAPPSFGEEEQYHVQASASALASAASGPIEEKVDANSYYILPSSTFASTGIIEPTIEKEKVYANA